MVDNKLKILHIIYDSPNNIWMGGGGANRIYEIYSKFKNKENIQIISGRFGKIKSEKIGGLKYLYIGISINYIISRLTYIIGCFFYVLFNYKKFDLIIEELGPCPLFLPLYLKKEKIIGSVQVLLEYNSNKNIIRKLLWVLQKKAIQVYKNLITVSNFGKNEIKKNVNGKFNIKVIYPGIEIQKAKKHKPEKFKIIKKKYILYLGRLDYIPKGLDILLKAMQNVKSDIALVIAGNGKKNDIQNINNDIKKFNLGERVILTGSVHNDEKSYLINNCLALCLPSRNEQMPLTIFEAFYFSKPVICSKIGGMIEIITKSKGGLFFENDNDKDLANKLKILINNRKLREKLGKSGNKYIKSFTWDLCAINTYEFYKSIYNE